MSVVGNIILVEVPECDIVGVVGSHTTHWIYSYDDVIAVQREAKERGIMVFWDSDINETIGALLVDYINRSATAAP